MDFSLSEEQVIFRDSVARFLADEYPFDRRQALVAEGDGFSPDHWRAFADLGWLALPFPEDYGGLGGSPVETMLLMEQFGRHLVASPYFASIVLGGQLLVEGGSEAQKTELLPALGAGELKLAFAFAESQARYDLTDVETRAEPVGDGFRISGCKTMVFHGGVADQLIVLARTAGPARDRDGLSLFLVTPEAAGLASRHYRTQDGGRASDLRLDAVRVGPEALIGPLGAAAPLVERVADVAVAALTAEAVGAMWAIYEQSLDYAKTRTQFGQALGSFQALQHRLVDLYMKCQLAQSMMQDATLSLAAAGRVAAARAAAAAKYKVGDCARAVGQDGIQLHGGIGMTMDLPIGHYFKRLTMINVTLGDPSHHLRRYGAMSYDSREGQESDGRGLSG